MNINFNNLKTHFIKLLTDPRYLATVFLFVGVIGVGVGRQISNLYALLFPLAIIGGAVTYLLYRNEIWKAAPNNYRAHRVPPRLTVSVYLLFFSALVATQIANPTGRSLLQYVIPILLYVLSLYFLIMYKRPIVGLGIVLLSGLVHRATIYYSSALYIGNDVFIHSDVAHQITQAGSLVPLQDSQYFYAPLYHLLIAEGNSVIDLGIRHSAFLVGTAVSVIVVSLVVFILGSIIGNRQVGAIASLLYTSADFAIQRSIQPSTTLLGIVFFSLGILYLIRYIRSGENSQLIIMFVFFSSLLLTHQLSTVVFFICASGFLLFYNIHNRSAFRRSINILVAILCSVFIDFIITRHSGPGSETFVNYLLTGLISDLLSASPDTSTRLTLPADPAISVGGSASLTTVHVLGISILLGAAVFGSLYWLSHNDRDVRLTAYGLGGIVFVSLTTVLAGPLVGMRTVIPYRWFPFIYIPLAILGAILFLFVSRTTATIANRQSFVVGLTIFVLVFGGYFMIMTGNFAGSYDKPLFDEALGAEQYGISEQEKQMYERMSEIDSGETVYTGDHRTIRMLFHYYGLNTEPVRMKYGEPDTIPNNNNNEIIVNRAYLTTPQAQFDLSYQGQINRVHGGVPVDELDNTNRSIIYNLGDHDLQWIY